MILYEMFEPPKPQPTIIDALGDFLPIAFEHLKLDRMPKINLVKEITSGDQPAFGQFNVSAKVIDIVVHNRNPVDILRTLAHELVHYAQGQRNELDADSGVTGSPIENEANAQAGVIMRVFAKQHPVYLTLPAISVPDQLAEKRKNKRKKKAKSPRMGGYYGYYWGGGDSGSDGGGDGGGGESVQENFADGKKPGRKGLAKRSGVLEHMEQYVAEDAENFNGIDMSFEIQKDDEYVDDDDYDNQVIYVTASSNGKELGHVLFAFDGEYLLPQDLEVDERFRGQGIAATMYDYVKSKGYKIRRSGQQTDAGAGFWDKHKPGQNVWEQGIEENFADGKKPGRKGLAKRSGVNTKASVSSLRKTAKNSSGEKQRMAHWLANMKAGRAKKKG